MKTWTKAVAMTATALLVTLVPGYAANAEESAPDSGEELVEVRFGPSLDDSVFLGYEDQEPVSTFLFDPADSLACDVGNNAGWVIATIEDTWPYTNGSTTIWPGGDVDLLCGTDTTSGFKHIRYRHQWGNVFHPNSWEALRASASDALGYSAPQTWDDFMWAAAQDTMEWAMPTPVKQTANQTTCFSAPFHIWKGDQIYSSWYANTVVSYTNFEIVTAFLSDNSSVADCSE